MRRIASALVGSLCCVSLVLAAFVGATSATERGIVLDQGGFGRAIPRGYSPSADLPACEFRRYARDGHHYQQIFTGDNDSCSPHTDGAPRKGDVSIYRRFRVGQDDVEYYKAWAVTRMINPHNAVAQVKLIFRDVDLTPPGVAECYGITDSTSFTTINTGQSQLGINDRDRPEVSDSGGCRVPDGVDQVAVHFRVRAREIGAYGKAVLDHLRFGRCRDNGDCSNVPAP